MNLRNKFFILLIVFLFVLSFFSSTSLGYYDFEYGDVSYRVGDNLTNNLSYWLLLHGYSSSWGGDYFVFIGSNYPLYTTDNGSSRFFYSLDPINGETGFYVGEFGNYSGRFPLSIDKMETCSVDDLEYCSARSGSSLYYGKELIYSTHDVYSYDGETLVFQGAPLPPQVVEPMKIAQVEEIPQEVIKVVQMIIPVCLAIFGMLLVLYLIKSKNLLQM